MPVDLAKLEKVCDNFLVLAEKSSKRKLDPSAKVRNRGEVIFPAESPNVLDHKDHFKIGTIAEARAALSYAGHYKSAPPWYKGSLEQLKATIRRKVKSKFPSIEVSEPKKKSSEVLHMLTEKYGEME
jgi:hypothetical protein